VNVYISPLAGTDSITTMHIQIIQNRAIILDTVQQVYVQSLYTPLPYIRMKCSFPFSEKKKRHTSEIAECLP
jgi:hypothetical protein